MKSVDTPHTWVAHRIEKSVPGDAPLDCGIWVPCSSLWGVARVLNPDSAAPLPRCGVGDVSSEDQFVVTLSSTPGILLDVTDAWRRSARTPPPPPTHEGPHK